MERKTSTTSQNLFRGLLFTVAFAIVLFSQHVIFDSTCLSAVLVFLLVPFLGFAFHIRSLNPSKSHSAKSLLFHYFLQLLLLLLGYFAHRRFIKSITNFVPTQEAILRQILSKNRNTRYGKDHRFREIRNKEDFVRRVPLTVYSDYESYIEEIVNTKGAKAVLTADEVTYLATSSGTTGKNKYIPITSLLTKKILLEIFPMVFYLQSIIEGLTLRRVLMISYRARTRTSKSGLRLGPASANMFSYPTYIVSPSEVHDIANEQLVLHMLALFGLAERDIGRIESLIATLVYSFWRYIEVNWKLICEEIETGKMMFHKDMSATGEVDLKGLESVVRKHFRPDPDRARQLREEFGKGFVGIAKRVWPGLQSVRMATSGGFAQHALLLRTIHMQGVAQLSFMYGGSEGMYGINLSRKNHSSEPQYTLMPQYGFFEFIEESKIDEERPETLFAEQVQLNCSYEVVYTSQSGLYRYRTGDVITISSFVNNCPTYTFAYRTGQMLNLYWEKTPEAVFYSAVSHTIDSVEGLVLAGYTATEDIYVPTLTDKNVSAKHYVLFIEVEMNGKEVKLSDDVLNKFDESLSQKFELYATLRRSQSIGPMKVYQVRRGAFDRTKTATTGNNKKSELSFENPQYKFPRVMRNPDFLQLLEKEILI